MATPTLLKSLATAGALQTALKGINEQARRKQADPKTVQQFKNNPLEFVRWAWRWKQPGILERFDGPDKWQEEFLIDLGREVKERDFNGRDAVAPIRMTISAGNGPGKGALMSWVVCWIMATRPYCQGTVTANTYVQLETKTWAAIQNWFRMSRMASQFRIAGGGIQHGISGNAWKCTPQTCREENAEAFAGQHAANSTSFYVFDEASAIPERIWEMAEGGLSDGAPMFFATGNATRNSGKFYRINFGSETHRWDHRTIDSRDCMMPNKKEIAEWIEDYGEDSDFVRVHVKGLPPQSSEFQFIEPSSVYGSQTRLFEVLADEPLIAGVDCSRGGDDKTVIRFRRGDDARTIPAIKWPGEHVRDSMVLVARLADLASQRINGLKVHTWFVDGGGIGGPIIDRLHQLGLKNFVEIQFGAQCPDARHFQNMRVWMWSKMREALRNRLSIDKDRELELGLLSVGLGKTDKTDRIILESKESMRKRGQASPDDADALALTFARPVAVPEIPRTKTSAHRHIGGGGGWMAS